MSKEYHGEYVKIERTRCDVCKRLVPLSVVAKGVYDTNTDIKVDLCSWRCGDRYWERYQVQLSGPSSNTGVNIGLTAEKGEAKNAGQ